MDLVCPAGNLPALKGAVDHGANAVYMGFRDDTNARSFPGLNFSEGNARDGIRYAHAKGTRVYVPVTKASLVHRYVGAGETAPKLSTVGGKEWDKRKVAVSKSVEGIAVELLETHARRDALIIADMAVLDYAMRAHPDLPRHLSVQGSASNHEAIRFYHEEFGVRRVVLPRVLSLAQVARVIEQVPVEVEVFGFGGLCVMVEGRCTLSSYATGQSPNSCGVCSPASAVRWTETEQGLESRLGELLIDRYGAGEHAGYPRGASAARPTCARSRRCGARRSTRWPATPRASRCATTGSRRSARCRRARRPRSAPTTAPGSEHKRARQSPPDPRPGPVPLAARAPRGLLRRGRHRPRRGGLPRRDGLLEAP